MTYVKICGITNREDAHAAIDAGADALGFIAVPESPRFVAASDFHRIRDVLPENFPLVVVVKRPGDAYKYRPPVIQFYEDGTLDDGLPAETKRVKVYRIHERDDILAAKTPPDGIDAVLLDAFHTALLGGSGTRFDWSWAEMLQAGARKPYILAGGLHKGNVAQALTDVRPYAVDVSSGVEDTTPGKKCHELVRKFIDAVRAWDKENGVRPASVGFLG